VAGLPGGGDPTRRGMSPPSHAELARVVREHAGQLAAALVSLVGDFATAEDLVQDAIEAALVRWPAEGIPERPDAWLYTVARRRGLDLLRREHRYRDKLALVPWPAPPEPDDRLRLIFTCCHPALPRAAQVALTLRVVCGLTTAQIAKAFLVPESTVGQRITRAKRKIGQAGIPYRIPSADELGARLTEVLAVIYSSDPGRTSSRPRSSPAMPKPPGGRTPTGPRSSCCTTCSCTWHPPPWRGCTGPSHCATYRDQPTHCPKWTVSVPSWTTTTCTTRPARNCCASSTAPSRQLTPTGMLWP
jgi:RNA polymerase sigma factor (sigma-70 family)